MDGEAGWWTTSGKIGLPPQARVMEWVDNISNNVIVSLPYLKERKFLTLPPENIIILAIAMLTDNLEFLQYLCTLYIVNYN